MTATEVLRHLLDERGVEWMPIAWNPKKETFYHTSNGVGFCADEYADGVKIYTDATITPEQAIAATLGSCNCSSNCTKGERTETCHDKNGFDVTFGFECTVCGAMTDGYMLSPADTGHYKQFNFCPMCGRRIEQ